MNTWLIGVIITVLTNLFAEYIKKYIPSRWMPVAVIITSQLLYIIQTLLLGGDIALAIPQGLICSAGAMGIHETLSHTIAGKKD